MQYSIYTTSTSSHQMDSVNHCDCKVFLQQFLVYIEIRGSKSVYGLKITFKVRYSTFADSEGTVPSPSTYEYNGWSIVKKETYEKTFATP